MPNSIIKILFFIFVIVSSIISLSACKEEKKPLTSGYVETNLFYFASPTGGYLKELSIKEGDAVKKNQRLFKLEKQDAVTAPDKGNIVEVMYQKEEYVPPAQPIASLSIPNQMKIIFYVPEKNLKKIALNKEIFVILNHKKYPAKVIYIGNQAEYTPDAFFSEKNRDKLVYRVKTVIPAELQTILKSGQPVDIDYE